MANVLNRTTRQYFRSVYESYYLTQSWIINPDVVEVVGIDSKYWTITGDAVTLTTQPQRDAVDAAELQARRDSEAGQLDGMEGLLRTLMLVVLDEFNAHAAKHNAILDPIDGASSLANLKTTVTLLPDYPARTAAQLKNSVRNKLGS